MDVAHYANQLLPFLKSRTKLSYLGAVLALVVCQQVYSIFRIPRSLRHLPAVSFLAQAKSFLTNESVGDRNVRLIHPATSSSNGFYVARVPVDWTVYITNPVAARTLLLKTDKFPKSLAMLDALGPTSPFVQFVGLHNVALSNGEIWKNQRKVINPAFRRAMPVHTFGSMMPKVFRRIDEEQEVVVIKLMQRLTLDALGNSIFGFDFKALEEAESVWVLTYNKVMESLFDPVPNLFPRYYFLLRWLLPGRRASVKATAEMNKLLLGMAQKRRETLLQQKDKEGSADKPDSEKDLLTLMLEAEMRGEGIISDEDLRSNLAIFFLAGHDTTANTLTFCLYHLAVNKHVQEKARDEVLEVLGDAPADVFPTADQCKQLTYLDMVIKENLRMISPADQLLPREALEDTYLDGTFIPKGTRVSVDMQAMHNDPNVWNNPSKFDPERFATGGEHDQHVGLTWLPFSNGTRQCLGMNFSLTEQRVVLSMLLRKYQWELPTDSIHKDKLIFEQPFNVGPTTLKIKFTRRY